MKLTLLLDKKNRLETHYTQNTQTEIDLKLVLTFAALLTRAFILEHD